MSPKEEIIKILEYFFISESVKNNDYFYKYEWGHGNNEYRWQLDGEYNFDNLADKILALKK